MCVGIFWFAHCLFTMVGDRGVLSSLLLLADPALAAMRRTAASQACRGVSHVPVAPLISSGLLPPLCSHTDIVRLTLTHSVFSTFKYSNISLRLPAHF